MRFTQQIERNAAGHVRCTKCGEFKPPDLMKQWAKGPRGICRRCAHRIYDTPEHLQRKLKRERAMRQAMAQLNARHVDELTVLYRQALERQGDVIIVQVHDVAAHIRRVYADVWPVDP